VRCNRGLYRAIGIFGDRGYRYVHFEAGAIGHRLYLAAEALGLGATGIGAFYDDEVHRHLNLMPKQGQVIYHFAIGYPIFPIRAFQHPMRYRKSHGRHTRAWRQFVRSAIGLHLEASGVFEHAMGVRGMVLCLPVS
jgi:hypothetical protein